MYSPKINERHIPVIYRMAKSEKKTMTKIIDNILHNTLYELCHCQSCNAVIEVEIGTDTAYCEYCETEVFLKELI